MTTPTPTPTGSTGTTATSTNPLVTAAIDGVMTVVEDMLRRRAAAGMTSAEREALSREVQKQSEALVKAANNRFDQVVGRGPTPTPTPTGGSSGSTPAGGTPGAA